MRSIADFMLAFEGDLQMRKSMSVRQVVDYFAARGFGVVLLFFAVPMALPLPVPPGVNIVLASPLLLLTVQQMIGRQAIWLPDFVAKKAVTHDGLGASLPKIADALQRVELWLRPRLEFLTSGIAQRVIGALGFIMALCICIPLPLTNTVPSFGIALMAIGVLARDGLAVMAGALVGALWVVMLAYVFCVFGPEGAEHVKSFIRSLF